MFNQDGSLKDEENRQLKQLDVLLTELEWHAVAYANQRKASGVPQVVTVATLANNT